MKNIDLKNTHILKQLFNDTTDSCTESCFQGIAGRAFADDDKQPSAAAIVLGEYMYMDGDADKKDFIIKAAEYAKHKKLTIITMNTKMRSYLLSHYEKNIKIKKRYQNNTTPDLKMKKLYKNIDTLPSEFELAVINESIYLQSLKNTWSEYFVKNFKNYQDFSEHGLGYAVLCKGKLVSGASSYSYCRTGYEVVVATDPDFRRQGLALTCSSAFLIECAKRNKIPYWDCANKKSLSLSKKIGYSLVREYEGIRIVTTDTIS